MTIRFISKWTLTLKKPGVWADVLQGNCKVFSSVKKNYKGGPAHEHAGHFLSFHEKHMQLPSFQNCGF